MSDYDTQLKSWGATGSIYPTGYSHIEGEQPVDDWDNFFKHNTIEDVKHLISLTNKRVETGSGSAFPTSPNTSHAFYRSDKERLYTWDSTRSEWNGLLKFDGDSMEGDLDLGGNNLSGVGSLTLAGQVDLGGNDLKDTASGKLLYDASAGSIPLDALEQSGVTVNAGSHVSGGGTISLGGSVTVNVDDDFLLNSGDRVTGELVGERSSSSRVFTAAASGSGDKLSLRVSSTDTFQFVGYDSSDGAWDYNSAFTYDPGNARWSFGSLPSVNGNNIATQTWVDANADVPNADYADSAGDANTLDGHDSTYFTTLSEVNNNADVPNADYADSAGDADTLEGNQASHFTTLSEVNTSADVPNADYADSAGSANTATNSNQYDNVSPSDGSSDEVLTTDGSNASWQSGAGNVNTILDEKNPSKQSSGTTNLSGNGGVIDKIIWDPWTTYEDTEYTINYHDGSSDTVSKYDGEHTWTTKNFGSHGGKRAVSVTYNTGDGKTRIFATVSGVGI